METGNQILLLLLVFILIGSFLYQMTRSRIAEPRRTDVIDDLIASEGWQLEATAPTSLVSQYLGFPFFFHSAAKEVRNVIRGHIDGIHFVAFDYRYMKQIHGAYRRTSQTVTIIIVEMTGTNFPAFTLVEPRTLESPFSDYEVIENVGLYRIEGIEKEAVRDILTDEVITIAPEFNIQGEGERLLYYSSRRRSQPDHLVQEVHHAVAFAQSLAVRTRGRSHYQDHEYVV